jgi:hypothetical protein
VSPPRPGDPHPTPDNLRPLRPATILDVTGKIDALAADMRHHEIAEKDHRGLLGQQHIEVKALREIALEHTERFDALDRRLDAIGTSTLVAKSEASRAAAGVGQVRDEVASLGRDVADLTAAMIHERADTASRSKAIVSETSNKSAAKSGGVVALLYVIAEIVRLLLSSNG